MLGGKGGAASTPKRVKKGTDAGKGEAEKVDDLAESGSGNDVAQIDAMVE